MGVSRLVPLVPPAPPAEGPRIKNRTHPSPSMRASCERAAAAPPCRSTLALLHDSVHRKEVAKAAAKRVRIFSRCVPPRVRSARERDAYFEFRARLCSKRIVQRCVVGVLRRRRERRCSVHGVERSLPAEARSPDCVGELVRDARAAFAGARWTEARALRDAAQPPKNI